MGRLLRVEKVDIGFRSTGWDPERSNLLRTIKTAEVGVLIGWGLQYATNEDGEGYTITYVDVEFNTDDDEAAEEYASELWNHIKAVYRPNENISTTWRTIL